MTAEMTEFADPFPRPSRTDSRYKAGVSAVDPVTSDIQVEHPSREMSPDILSDIHKSYLKKSPPSEPLVRFHSEADWERSTVSTSSYGSSARSAGIRKSLPSLPSTIGTIDESDPRIYKTGLKMSVDDAGPASFPQKRFNSKQLDALAISYFYQERERMWNSIAEETGENWQDVEFNVRIIGTCFAWLLTESTVHGTRCRQTS